MPIRRPTFERLEDRTLLAANHAPVLDVAGPTVLDAVYPSAVENPGVLVAQLAGSRLSDADPGAKPGIAVVRADNTFGHWQFSLDNGGTWSEVADTYIGGASVWSSRLLVADGQTRLRFVPLAGWHGDAEMDFRAWDQTDGKPNGGLTGTSDTGGSSAFSAAVESATVTVVPMIGLTSDTVLEHQPIETVVGSFTVDGAYDPRYTFSLVNGPGDSANGGFSVAGAQLRTASDQSDYASGPWTYTVRVLAVGPEGSKLEQVVRVHLENDNRPPTEILLSSAALSENQPVGGVVAALSASDPDVYDRFTFQLVGGAGSDDNARFTIRNDLLASNAVFNHQQQDTYRIRLRVTDQAGLSLEQPFVLNVLASGPTTTLAPYRVFTWVHPEQESEYVRHVWNDGIDPGAGNAYWKRPDLAAQALAGAPAGQRALIVQPVDLLPDGTKIFSNPADAIYDPTQDGSSSPTPYWGPWFSHGLQAARQQVTGYFQAMKDAGLTSLDALMLDWEGYNLSFWSAVASPAARIRAIRADPRYADFAAQFEAAFPEIFADGEHFELNAFWADGNWRLTGQQGLQSLFYWSSFIQSWYDRALNEAIYEAARSVFPGVVAGNFGASGTSVSDALQQGINWPQMAINGMWADFSSPVLYDGVGGLNLGQTWTDPYRNFQLMVNSARSAVRQYPNLPVIPWFGNRSYTGGTPSIVPLANTDYWQEMVMHTMLSTGSTNAFVFNPTFVAVNGSRWTYDADVPYFESVLTSLESLAPNGFHADHPLELLRYDDRFSVSYATTDSGRIVGRVTFGGTTSQATFSVGGISLTVDRTAGLAAGATPPAGEFFVIDPPAAADDRYQVVQNAPLVVGPGGVLSNDADPASRPLQATIVAGPAHGTLLLAADGSFVYTPDAGFWGTDRFTYRASNGAASSQPASVLVNVSTPLRIAIGGPVDGFQGVPGQPRTFSLLATDPSPAALPVPFNYRIHWGDGSPLQTVPRSAISVDHAFASAGTFTPQVVAETADGWTSPTALGPTLTIAPVEKQGPNLALGGTSDVDAISLTKTGSTGTFAISVNAINHGTRTLATSGRIQVFGDGSDRVTIAGTSGNDRIRATAGAVEINGFAIDLAGIGRLTLDGRTGTDVLTGPDQANTWRLETFGAGTLNSWTTLLNIESLIGGALDDRFQLTSTARDTRIDGGAGHNTLDYSLVRTSIGVNLGSASASLVARFQNIQAFVGSMGGSSLRAGNGTNTWTIDGVNAGSLNGMRFSGFRDLVGGIGRDTIGITNTGRLDGLLDGGTGADALDYSSYSTQGVQVDLGTGTASALGTVRNIRVLIGTSLADRLTAGKTPTLLIGGAGSDVLVGGNARVVLVGGRGDDLLRAGSGESILFGGGTAYYDETSNALNLTAVDAILQQWAQAVSYASRVSRLQSQWINGATFTPESKAVDQLFGGTGLDWYLIPAGSVPPTAGPSETVSAL